jgi:hypothetical protein
MLLLLMLPMLLYDEVFVHGGSPSTPILFLYRDARLCHRSPTNKSVVGASCGLALTDLGGSTKNVQFYRCGTESREGKYWVRGYATRQLRICVVTVPTKWYVVILTNSRPLHGLCSFSFIQTELLSSFYPTHPYRGADRKFVLSDRDIIYGDCFHASLIAHNVDMYYADNCS